MYGSRRKTLSAMVSFSDREYHHKSLINMLSTSLTSFTPTSVRRSLILHLGIVQCSTTRLSALRERHPNSGPKAIGKM